MADNIHASPKAPYCPSPDSYAVVRLDPVAMVEHLNDREALASARAMKPKTYLVYIDCVSSV